MHRRYVHRLGMHEIKRESAKTLKFGRFGGVRDITAFESLSPTACFMGPRAQNAAAMRELATRAIDNVVAFRESFKPTDPNIVLDTDNGASIDEMMTRFDEMLVSLKDYSTPFTAMRYQAHMTWDNLLPALGAYFATMMYNPNNVTIQASTATTLFEMQAMRDLCDMFAMPPIARETPEGTYVSGPWAHVAADGTIANIEGAWSSREAKYLPFAMRDAINDVSLGLGAASNIEVEVCNGDIVRLLDAAPWQLLNIVREKRLELPKRVADLTGRDVSEIWPLLVEFDVNAMGIAAFGATPIMLIPSTAHYSWPKAAGLLGIGTNHCVHVDVDVNARMSIAGTYGLRARLEHAHANQTPILCVVSVFGSTEESAVDPLDQILALRDEFRGRGLDFDIHVDSAWGGYFVSTIRRPYAFDEGDPIDPFLTNAELDGGAISDYVAEQARHIRLADSLTIDPHKMGYVQYPAGAVAYANQDVINLTTFTGSYIGSSADPTVGMFGIEGSRPGASAAAVYFSHVCLRPDVDGYGKVISKAMKNRLDYYLLLDDVRAAGAYKTVTLTPYPTDLDIEALKTAVRAGEDVLAANPELRQIGPDQNIVDFGINVYVGGALNTDAEVYNAFVNEVYKQFSIAFSGDGQAENIQNRQFLVSMTTFDRAIYGDAFMDQFATDLGLTGSPQKLNCLRSTVMDPFIDKVQGTAGPESWWPTIIDIMNQGVAEVTRRRNA